MNTKHNISDWLDKLQQESWNLELLISGFSIFLLVQAQGQFGAVATYVDVHFNFEPQIRGMFITFWGIIILSCYALIFSLIFHILIRGFWIGTIGLRSVQPKVDYQRLRYAPAFEQGLQAKLSSLDRMLIRLDQISSAVFSFAFLLVFMLISLAAWFIGLSLAIGLFDPVLEWLGDKSTLAKVIKIIALVFVFIYLFMSLIYALDTLFVGIIKKWKRTSRIYKWIYELLTRTTLSIFYRSIYYHLVSYIGVWSSRFLFNFFILGMVLFPFFRYEHEIFYPDFGTKNKTYTYYYDDMRPEEEIIWDASIPSSVIKENSLPLFIRYSPKRNETLLHICDYKPSKKQGLISGIYIGKEGVNLNDPRKEEASPDSLLNCLSSIYEVRIDDSLFQDIRYYYMAHFNQEELGIYTVLDIKDFSRGHHSLSVDYKDWQEEKDTVLMKNWVSIPFWKE
ncbi:MAG: hypothetical protein AAGG68_16480 [Bacteroidota bacterium]